MKNMRCNVRWFLPILLIFCILGSVMPSIYVNAAVVDPTSSIYSYEEMINELNALQTQYPEHLQVTFPAATSQGRPIPVAYLGNLNAPHHVMVQASMHAREYRSAHLVMEMLEHYLTNYKTGTWNGVTYHALLDQVCFVIMPMANPDGVAIVQQGPDACVTPASKNFYQLLSTMTSLRNVKANANAVDINKNFSVGFGLGRYMSHVPSHEFYCGPSPASEIETITLMNVAQQFDYSCYLNYHTMGNVIYYGSVAGTKELNQTSKNLALSIKKLSGYSLLGASENIPSGTFADWIVVVLGKPSATIEIGTTNPVPVPQLNSAFERNKNVWANTAWLI